MPDRPAGAAQYPGTARLAVTLAGVSGYVDGVGATTLAGLFVSFMSGNTTSTGLAVGQGLWAKAGHAGLPVLLYVLGSLLGALLLAASPRARALPRTYALCALLLALFAGLTLAVPHRAGWVEALATALLVLPMAAMNATLRHVGGASVGLGYVTGTLAGLGEVLATAISGPRAAGRAREIWLHVGLWLGFFLGAALGAYATHRVSSWAVALPVVVLGVAAVQTAHNPPPHPADL